MTSMTGTVNRPQLPTSMEEINKEDDSLAQHLDRASEDNSKGIKQEDYDDFLQDYLSKTPEENGSTTSTFKEDFMAMKMEDQNINNGDMTSMNTIQVIPAKNKTSVEKNLHINALL